MNERVQNEVPTVPNKCDSLKLDIGSNDDEGDDKGIEDHNSVKLLNRDST
jgi:hypothetical protein